MAKTARRRSARAVVALSSGGEEADGAALMLPEEEREEEEEEEEEEAEQETSGERRERERRALDVRIACGTLRLSEHETPPPEQRRAARDAKGSSARGTGRADAWAGGSGGNERRIVICFLLRRLNCGVLLSS